MPNISILSGVLTSEILELNYLKSYIYEVFIVDIILNIINGKQCGAI